MQKEEQKEFIEIKYIYPDNYANLKKIKSINNSKEKKMVLNGNLINDNIKSEILYKLLIHNLANTSDLLYYNNLKNLSHRHNDIKGILLTSSLAKIFGIEEKYIPEYPNISEEKVVDAYSNPNFILALGWKGIFDEEQEFDNLDDISDDIWLIFDKVLAAISANKKEIFLTKHEKAVIDHNMSAVWGRKFPKLNSNSSYLELRQRLNRKTASKEDKRRIHEKIKELMESEGKEKVKVRDVDKGKRIKIANYLTLIYGGLARYKVTLPLLTNINTHKSVIEYEKRFKLDLNEEIKYLASMEQEIDKENEYISNMSQDDFVKKYYRFAKNMIKLIDKEKCEPKKDDRKRFLDYYMLEQLFAFELFEYVIKYINAKRSYFKIGEKEFLKNASGLGKILGDIYNFPYVFMRKRIAKEAIYSYFKLPSHNVFAETEWIRKYRKKIERKQKGIEHIEKAFICGLFCKNEYSVNDIWDMLNVDIMSWYETKRSEILSQKEEGVSRNLFEVLENKDSLIAKWVIYVSLQPVWKDQ